MSHLGLTPVAPPSDADRVARHPSVQRPSHWLPHHRRRVHARLGGAAQSIFATATTSASRTECALALAATTPDASNSP